MNKLYYILILLVSLIIFFFPQTLFAQEERVAVVSTFDGEVKIQHGGVWKTVTRVGNRIKNSAVYNDDTVLTMPGSTAVLIFNDNTRMEVSEDSTLIVSEKQITDKRGQQNFVTPASGTLKKEIVRSIKIKAGGLWAHVTPSKSILTEFETPTGVAAVRGTTVTFHEQPDGSFAVQTIEGLMGFVTPGDNPVTFDIGGGDVVTIGMSAAGSVSLNVNSGNIEVNTLTGDVVNLNVGDGVEMGSTDTGGTSVTVTATGADGGVTVETGSGNVEMGTGEGIEISEDSGGNATIDVTNGEVTVTNPRTGETENVSTGEAVGGGDTGNSGNGGNNSGDNESSGNDGNSDGSSANGNGDDSGVGGGGQNQNDLGSQNADQNNSQNDGTGTVAHVMDGSDAMELLNYNGIGGASIPEDPGSVVIGNDLFPDIDISPAGYIHGNIENDDGDGERDTDGLIASIINDGHNNDDDGVIQDEGFGISFTEDGDSTDHVATFRDVAVGADNEGPNVEQNDTKGVSFYSRATDTSVVANTSFGDLLVSHDYRITDDGNVLVADVTMVNTGDMVLSDLKYRRKVDVGIDEGTGAFIVPSMDPGDTSIEFVAAPHVNNASSNPLSSDTTNRAPGTYTADSAAIIQLDLGTLAPNESKTFPVFFAADNPTYDELDPLNSAPLRTASENLQASIDNVVSPTYIEVSDPLDSNAVFALGSGTLNLSEPTSVIAEDKDHFKLLTDSMSLLIGHLSKQSYSSHAETIVDSSDGLTNPTGIAVHNGILFVTDDDEGSSDEDRVWAIQETNEGGSNNWAVNPIVGPGSGLNNPSDIATDKDGNLLITGDGNSNDDGIFRVVDSGTDAGWEVDQIAGSGSGFNNPTGIAIDHGNDLNNIFDDKIYVTDDGIDKVFQLVYGEGLEVSEVAGEVGTGARINEPQGIAVLSSGGLRVVDTGSDALLRVDPWDGDGDTFRLATEGSTHGKLDEPVDIVADDDGFLYIVDSHNNTINKLVHGGTGPKFLASSRTTDTLANPVGIAIDNNNTSDDTSDDIMYIIDNEKKSVVKLTKTTNDKTLLAFANKLHADLIKHGTEFHSSGDMEAIVSGVEGVISDIQQNVASPNTISNTAIISDLETVRANLAAHAGLESIFDHVDLTHLIGDARNIAADRRGNGVQLNLDVIEANIDKAKAYLLTHINEEGSSTELDSIMNGINNIKTDIGLVRNDITDTVAIDRVEDSLDSVFESLVDHISPGNNPFKSPYAIDNVDAVKMMFNNGVGGAFVPSLAINTVNKIDNDTIEVGISQDGSIIEANGSSENGDVLTPGSTNEGYGVSYDAGGNEFLVRVGSGDGADSSSYDTSIYTKGSQYNSETFTNKTGVDRTDSSIKGNLDITHKFELAPPDLHIGAEGFSHEKMMAVTVTMTNTGIDPISNLKYRRVADFDNDDSSVFADNKFTVPDVGSTTSGDATLGLAGAPSFFPDYDPEASGSSSPGDYTGDRAALLQFDVGTLAADESKTFTFFYAADKSSTNLTNTINSLVEDAKYIASTRSGSQPYHAFALGTGSSNSISNVDTSTESQHFNILSDTLSLMLGNLAHVEYVAKTVVSEDSLGINIMDNPKDITIDDNHDLIVVDESSEKVLRLSETTPGVWTTTEITDKPTSGNLLSDPNGVAIAGNGDIFITDDGTDTILKVDPSNGSTSVIASEGTEGMAVIDNPSGVAIDNNGDLIVVDESSEKVLRLSETTPGVWTTTVITDLATSGNLIEDPNGVAIASNGDIIITDDSTDAILKVDPSNGSTSVIASESTKGSLVIDNPEGVTIDSDGLLIVVNNDDGGSAGIDSVLRIDPVTGDTRVIATEASTGGKIDEPKGVASGSLFIADTGSDSIVELEETTSTNYLLAFARKIRGDMEVHDDEHTDESDATVHAAHQSFMDTIDDVIDDIEVNIDNPNTVDKMDLFAELKDARDLLMDDHADMKEPVQHASLAHILLDSKRLADDQVRLNLAPIHVALNQVKIFMAEHINDFGDTTVHRGIEYQIDSILANIGVLRDNIYDIAAASSIQSEIKETFCDVIDHTIRSDTLEGANPFHFCHGNMDEGT